MTRFSPQVRPTSAPSGLAQALQSGLAGYQSAQDRAEGQRDRERKRIIETDTLASQGLAPQLPETPETFGTAFSRALSGAPEPEPKRAVVPRAFLPEQGKFEDVDPLTGLPQRAMPLPSGGFYNPAVMESRVAGTTMAKGLAGNQVQASNRGMLRDEYGADVVAKGGTLAGAGDVGVMRSFLEKQPSALKVLGANAGNPAGIVDTEKGTFTPLPGTNAVPKSSSSRNPGTVRIPIGSQRELEDLGYYESATNNVISLIENRPESIGLDMVVGTKLTDRTDPHGVTVVANLATLSNQIRNGLFGTALSANEARLAADQLADKTNTEASAIARLRAILTYVDQRRAAIYGAATGVASFERGGTVPATAPATTPATPRKRSAFRAPEPRSAASILGGKP